MAIKTSLKEIYEKLTDEQKAMVQNCKNMDEIIALANTENYELSDNILDGISAGIGADCREQQCDYESDC